VRKQSGTKTYKHKTQSTNAQLTCPAHPEKFTRDNAVAPVLILSVVIVTTPFDTYRNAQTDGPITIIIITTNNNNPIYWQSFGSDGPIQGGKTKCAPYRHVNKSY